MKLRIKELCKQKGMRMSDVAEKVGVDYSNLIASLNGNPTLNRLTSVANALDVPVSELFEKKEEGRAKINGYVEISGEILPVRSVEDWVDASSRIGGFPSVPHYGSIADLRKDVRKFVLDNVRDIGRRDSLWGMIGTREVFCLSCANEVVSDGDENVDNKIFTLSLLNGGQTLTYDLIEYSDGGEYDLEGPLGMLTFIKNDMEKFMESFESADEC